MTTTLQHLDEGKGIPLLCIHAFPLDGRMWQPQLDGLKDVYRLIVPDLRGFGKSAVLPAATSLETHASDLAALLDEKGLRRAVVMGVSMGGYIALAFAKKYPDRVAGLVLADTKSTADSDEAKAGRDKSIATAKQPNGPATITEGLLPKLLHKDAAPALVEKVKSIGSSQQNEGVANALAAMRDRPDTTEVLKSVPAPVLCVVGEFDPVTPPEEARKMALAAKAGLLVTILNAAHLTNLEQPDAFNKALRFFSSGIRV